MIFHVCQAAGGPCAQRGGEPAFNKAPNVLSCIGKKDKGAKGMSQRTFLGVSGMVFSAIAVLCLACPGRHLCRTHLGLVARPVVGRLAFTQIAQPELVLAVATNVQTQDPTPTSFFLSKFPPVP